MQNLNQTKEQLDLEAQKIQLQHAQYHKERGLPFKALKRDEILELIDTEKIINEAVIIDPTIFPDVFSGVAGDFAKLFSNYLEVPHSFFFMAFLTCLGSVLSKRLTLASEIAPQPRLYTLLLGESADERKSTALVKTIEFFKDTLDQFPVCWGVGSAEGLQKRLEKDNSLLLCFDEFNQFVGKCKIEASVLLPCVNSLFELNHYESRTKTVSIELKDVHLSLLAASTLQTYQKTWGATFRDIGFTNRLWIVPDTAERRFSFPAKIPEDEKKDVRMKLVEILCHVGDGLEFSLSSWGEALYHDWYMKLEKSIHSKRIDVYALRLMSLLALNELKDQVDEEIIKKTIRLSNWQLEVRKLHDPLDADNVIAGMEQKIMRLLQRQPRPDRELKQHTHASRSGMWIYETAKRNLLRSKEIAFNPKEKCYLICSS